MEDSGELCCVGVVVGGNPCCCAGRVGSRSFWGIMRDNGGNSGGLCSEPVETSEEIMSAKNGILTTFNTLVVYCHDFMMAFVRCQR